MIFISGDFMDFVPNTLEQQKEMLHTIGVSSINELFKDIPSSILLQDPLAIGKGLSEIAVKRKLASLALRNKISYTSFLGAGSYAHFIPSIVNALISRGEFYTAYTPYQPEISQGVLQAIFEYQTLIADLTGMDVANASLYDGSTALAEACIMAHTITKRTQIVALKSVHPEYREVLKTYCTAHSFQLIEADQPTITDKTAALLIQNPDFFGSVHDLRKYAEQAHSQGALLVVNVVEPTSLGLLVPPGECGADIVVGEAQSFGNPINFGGPYLGIIATTEEFKRNIPGRLVGKTVDEEGQDGYILTLQAREQHIRREKSCSNICTNQALCALAASIHIAALGKTGIKELAELNLQKAHYLSRKLMENGCQLYFNGPFYNEFVLKLDDVNSTLKKLADKNIIGGLDLGKFYPDLKNCLLICVTELITKEDMDSFVETLS